jgi:hypothetical protein
VKQTPKNLALCHLQSISFSQWRSVPVVTEHPEEDASSTTSTTVTYNNLRVFTCVERLVKLNNRHSQTFKTNTLIVGSNSEHLSRISSVSFSSKFVSQFPSWAVPPMTTSLNLLNQKKIASELTTLVLRLKRSVDCNLDKSVSMNKQQQKFHSLRRYPLPTLAIDWSLLADHILPRKNIRSFSSFYLFLSFNVVEMIQPRSVHLGMKWNIT